LDQNQLSLPPQPGAALPKALFLAFTGTPLIAGEERTKEVFGDYVSIYDFQQSVEDGATVPLFYENRTPELQLVNPDLNEDIYDLIEAAELDPEQEAKLERPTLKTARHGSNSGLTQR
jgi:type I restriction enzyme R subunit